MTDEQKKSCAAAARLPINKDWRFTSEAIKRVVCVPPHAFLAREKKKRIKKKNQVLAEARAVPVNAGSASWQLIVNKWR